jgi:hypothetical protein
MRRIAVPAPGVRAQSWDLVRGVPELDELRMLADTYELSRVAIHLVR